MSFQITPNPRANGSGFAIFNNTRARGNSIISIDWDHITGVPGDFDGFADPSASVGLTATNGTAITAMRSDAAPALSQAIVPTWTGLHTFSAGLNSGANIAVTATNAGFVTADGTVSGIVSATNGFLTNSMVVGTLNDKPVGFIQNNVLHGSIGSDDFWNFKFGAYMSESNPTQSISFPTFDSSLPNYTTVFSVTGQYTGSLASAAGAIAGQIIVDSTTTGTDELQGVYGGAANKRASHPGLYGVSGVINNYSTATTPSGSGLFGIVRGDLATVSGASVTGVTGVRSVSEVAAGQHPNAAYFCYNSVATNAFSVGYYCASAADYGFRVGYGSGSGSNTIMPTYAYALIDTSDVLAFGVAAPSGNVSTIGTITKTATGATANATVNGLALTNNTAATAGNQQYSPAIILTAQGWKTNATAASQTNNVKIEARPVQGTVSPLMNYVVSSQINGGGYTDMLTIANNGGGGAVVTYNSQSGGTEFRLASAGTSYGVHYADSTQVISGSLTNLPYIIKQNNTEVGRFIAGGLQLGASGTLGTLTMGNATSGTIALRPVAGALGTQTLSLPAATGTLLYNGANLSDVSSAATSRDNLAVFGVVRTQVFTSSGTYTPHAKMLYCIIECVGGGGGGGGVDGTSPTNVTSSGGGSGAYGKSLKTAADIGASQTVTIGAGGSGGSAGANNGSAGGTTSVGTLCTAGGGGGGPYANTGTAGSTTGAPGSAGTANVIAIDGMSGGGGSFAATGSVPGVFGGFGGGSHYSGTAKVSYRSAGAAGKNYGGGGSGAMTDQTATLAGGAGAAGIVIITEFCTQ